MMVSFRSIRAAGILLFVLLLAPVVLAWEEADFKIFDLNDALKTSAGPKADFYSVLEVSRSASLSEINKAYRTVSRSLHPDKNPDPKAQELYTLITSINTLLKDEDLRERYDGHLRNGMPRWRGGKYLYNHWTPGPVTFVAIILLATSFVQYVSAWILYAQRSTHVAAARDSVNNLTYQQVKKQLKKTASPALSRKQFKSATPLQILQDEAMLPPGTVHVPPSVLDTVVVSLPRGIYRAVVQRFTASGGQGIEGDAAATTEGGAQGAARSTDSSPAGSGSENDAGSDATKRSGRRRKATAAQ
ncbi:hypothetical protein HKX48_005991 [Thoreauomyces humboldtii]|nr:hypothetical protein HKX48_005991 [Thoreauomyces humboldtii]